MLAKLLLSCYSWITIERGEDLAVTSTIVHQVRTQIDPRPTDLKYSTNNKTSLLHDEPWGHQTEECSDILTCIQILRYLLLLVTDDHHQTETLIHATATDFCIVSCFATDAAKLLLLQIHASAAVYGTEPAAVTEPLVLLQWQNVVLLHRTFCLRAAIE